VHCGEKCAREHAPSLAPLCALPRAWRRRAAVMTRGANG
jgi:hypothetical protein